MVKNQQLNQIKDGMAVVDNTGDTVGEVSYVHTGADTYTEDWAADPTGIKLSNVPIDARDQVPNAAPKEVVERLLQLGFIKIKTGLLSSSRYALQKHVATIETNKIYLNVAKDALPNF